MKERRMLSTTTMTMGDGWRRQWPHSTYGSGYSTVTACLPPTSSSWLSNLHLLIQLTISNPRINYTKFPPPPSPLPPSPSSSSSFIYPYFNCTHCYRLSIECIAFNWRLLEIFNDFYQLKRDFSFDFSKFTIEWNSEMISVWFGGFERIIFATKLGNFQRFSKGWTSRPK